MSKTTKKGSGVQSAQIEQISTAELIPYARNARTHSEQQVQQIAGSIQEFGFCNPVLIDAANGIIAGHGRVMAAQLLKLESVPCLRLSHLTDAQKRAYVLADNRIALSSGWDEEMLANELSDLHADEFDMALLGFDVEELEGLLGMQSVTEESDVDAEPRIDEAEELQGLWETKLGQVWRCGIHRLMCGSSTEAADVGRLLGGASPQIMVTDPPYGVKYDPSWRNEAGVSNSKRTGVVLNDDIADWTPAWRLFGGAVAYVWHGGLHSGVVQKSLIDAGFVSRAQVIWVKPRLVLSRGHYHWQHEPCWVADKPEQLEEKDCEEAWYAVRKNSTAGFVGGRKQTTVWEIGFKDEAKTVHGTQKPVECMARPIRNHSLSKDGVYEPFSGSGSTLIACEQLQRPCFAMELNPQYVAVALQRFKDATEKDPVLEVG
jgi:DNA modification methylase